jgi:hypothetical protein
MRLIDFTYYEAGTIVNEREVDIGFSGDVWGSHRRLTLVVVRGVCQLCEPGDDHRPLSLTDYRSAHFLLFEEADDAFNEFVEALLLPGETYALLLDLSGEK